MNILICSEFFYPSVGGAQKVAFELSTNLKKIEALAEKARENIR